jgi:hypothetical protein
MMLQRLHAENDELMGQIAEGKWDDSIEEQLGNAIAESIDDFGPDFDAEGNPLEEGESDRILSEDRDRDRPAEDEPAAGDGAEAEAEEREEAATA